MFERLKQAFSAVTSAVKEKQLSDEDLDKVIFDFQIALVESDVAQSVADALTENERKCLAGNKLKSAARP